MLGFLLALELNLMTQNLKFKHPSNLFKFSNLLGYFPTTVHSFPPLINLLVSQKVASILIDLIPYIGINLVEWIWRGFSVNKTTLTWFFAFYFLLLFIISALVIVYFFSLKQSDEPIGVLLDIDIILFHTHYTIKNNLGSLDIITSSTTITSFLFTWSPTRPW